MSLREWLGIKFPRPRHQIRTLPALDRVGRSHFPHPPPGPQLAAPVGGYNECMDVQSLVAPVRRPRFRRASEPPAFRLTNDDVAIVRHLAGHRFLRSTHIAALVGRSLDRTNNRLSRL